MTGQQDSRLRRVQWGIASALVAVLPWLIAPGKIQPDTKVDLTISPWRYLGRALSAWNDHAGFGELQNQAYGYLFPMGPVFGIGHSAGLPAWATQRLWWSILLVTAFTGMACLVRRLDLAGPRGAMLAGAAYALSPRVLTVLSEISIEAWPLALAPWLVLSSLRLTAVELTRRHTAYAAAVCGLLTAALGGVNATASGIVLVLPFCVLVTDRVGRRRLPVWGLATALGALWWLLPLFVLGRYSYPFLDFIETSSITTAVTSVPNVLRGASDWVAYILDGSNHPTWQGGWVVAQSLISIIATCTVAALGVWGVLRLRGHVARWTLLSLLIGTVFMAIGHGGVVGSPVAGGVQSLLDGALAPLRNVHKADPLVRVPLVLGLAVVCRTLASARPRLRLGNLAVVAVVVLAMTPLWQGRLGDAAAYGAVPSQWSTAARDVDAAAQVEGGSTLLLPNARTATYTWGKATDEPLSAMATSPIVTRASAPLGAPGSTRILDAADALAATGQPQASLAAGLARTGIARIVVRRDLDPSVGAASWEQVERTLATSPGFTRTQVIGTGEHALTVWRVTGAAGVAAYSSAAAVRLSGGPEAIFAALAAGIVSPQSALLTTGAGRPTVVSDTMGWRAYNNGVPTARAYSEVLPADDHAPKTFGAYDLPPAGDPNTQPTRVLRGLTGFRASSEASDPFAKQYAGASTSAYAAIDGDPSTRWLSASTARAQWLRLHLPPGAPVADITLALATGIGTTLPQSVTVIVNGAPKTVAVHGDSNISIPVALASGELLIQLNRDVADPRPVGIADLRLSGRSIGSAIQLPGTVDLSSQQFLLTHLPDEGHTLQRRVISDASATTTVSVRLRSTIAIADATRCGALGTVTLAGHAVGLRAPADQVPAGAVVTATSCGALHWAAGRQDLSVTPPNGATVESVVTGHDSPDSPDSPATAVKAADTRALSVKRSSADQRSMLLGAGGASIVTMTDGFNAGWRATLHGQRLVPIEVDGWRQGFQVPAGPGGELSISFAPGRLQAAGLVAGALAVLALLAVAALTARGRPRSAVRPAASSDQSTEAANEPPVGLLGAGCALVANGAVAGLYGVAIAVVVVVALRRWSWRVGALIAASALAVSGIALAALGVVDQRSIGAIAGQLLGTVSVAAVAAALGERLAVRDAPTAGPVAPAPTTMPPQASSTPQ